MISCEDKKDCKSLFVRNSRNILKKTGTNGGSTCKKEGAYVAFCECIGKHVSKIGVKFRKDNGDKGKMYYSTAYDNEKFDL